MNDEQDKKTLTSRRAFMQLTRTASADAGVAMAWSVIQRLLVFSQRTRC